MLFVGNPRNVFFQPRVATERNRLYMPLNLSADAFVVYELAFWNFEAG